MRTITAEQKNETEEAAELCNKLMLLSIQIDLHPNNRKKLEEITQEISWLNHLATRESMI